MSNTRNLAGLLNSSGLVPLPTKVAGVLPDANAPLGSVIQVVSTTKTDTFTTTSASFVDITGLAVSITPSSATSKILVMVQVVGNSDATASAGVRLLRDSTAIAIGDAAGSRVQISSSSFFSTGGTAETRQVGVTHLDSPNTTSSITYKLQTSANSGTAVINRSVNDSDNAFRPRAVSSITVMEIAA
jgi:hypothetical protein